MLQKNASVRPQPVGVVICRWQGIGNFAFNENELIYQHCTSLDLINGHCKLWQLHQRWKCFMWLVHRFSPTKVCRFKKCVNNVCLLYVVNIFNSRHFQIAVYLFMYLYATSKNWWKVGLSAIDFDGLLVISRFPNKHNNAMYSWTAANTYAIA